jgi:hypothetical protein
MAGNWVKGITRGMRRNGKMADERKEIGAVGEERKEDCPTFDFWNVDMLYFIHFQQ